MGAAPADGANVGIIKDATYSVSSGEHVFVPRGVPAILVDRFAMGDNSLLTIPVDTPVFVIWAKTANIGNGTRIVGRGQNGAKGEAPNRHGGSGSIGPTVLLIFERPEILGLTVAAIGGDGGPGGTGANGRRGRDPSCGPLGPRATPGGRGGRGTNGGAAGDGGQVILVFPLDTGTRGVALNVNSGVPGGRGIGGRGGPGGQTQVCRAGPFKWKRSGSIGGPDGPDGKAGRPGSLGIVVWRHLDGFAPPIVTNALRNLDIEALNRLLDSGLLPSR